MILLSMDFGTSLFDSLFCASDVFAGTSSVSLSLDDNEDKSLDAGDVIDLDGLFGSFSLLDGLFVFFCVLRELLGS